MPVECVRACTQMGWAAFAAVSVANVHNIQVICNQSLKMWFQASCLSTMQQSPAASAGAATGLSLRSRRSSRLQFLEPKLRSHENDAQRQYPESCDTGIQQHPSPPPSALAHASEHTHFLCCRSHTICVPVESRSCSIQ